MLDNTIVDGVNTVQTCPAVGYQSASVCVPVTVTPFAQAGPLPPSAAALP